MLSVDEARELLTAERARLDGLLASVEPPEAQAESMGELTAFDQHQGDSGTETTQQWQQIGLHRTLEHERAEIEAAWARVESGTYGLCEGCREPIADERLRAVPAARYCRDHQPGSELLTTRGRRG